VANKVANSRQVYFPFFEIIVA